MVGKEKLFSTRNSEKEIPNPSNPTPFTQIFSQFKQAKEQTKKRNPKPENLEPKAKALGDFEKLILFMFPVFINVGVSSVSLVLLKHVMKEGPDGLNLKTS